MLFGNQDGDGGGGGMNINGVAEDSIILLCHFCCSGFGILIR